MKICFRKIHKIIIFLICITLFLSGCNKVSGKSENNTEDVRKFPNDCCRYGKHEKYKRNENI